MTERGGWVQMFHQFFSLSSWLQTLGLGQTLTDNRNFVLISHMSGKSQAFGLLPAVISDASAWSWLRSGAGRTQPITYIYDAKLPSDGVTFGVKISANEQSFLNRKCNEVSTKTNKIPGG